MWSFKKKKNVVDSNVEIKSSIEQERLIIEKLEFTDNRRHRYIGLLALILSGLYAIWESILGPQFRYTHEFQKMEDQSNLELGVSEANFVMDLFKDLSQNDDIDQQLLKEKMCDLKHQNVIGSAAGVDKIDGFTDQGKACEAIIQRRLEAIEIGKKRERCEAQSVLEKNSCSASDKSGFQSRPSARCSVTVSAKEGRFLSISSYNVKRTGKGRTSSTSPSNSTSNVKHIRTTHACTDRSGTGRTCNVRANISAKSYPDECSDVI